MRPGEGCGLARLSPPRTRPGPTRTTSSTTSAVFGCSGSGSADATRVPRASCPAVRRGPVGLVADARTYPWTLRHRHGVADGGRSCRQTLTLYPRPAGVGGPPRIVFTEGPGRYVPMLLVNPGPRVTSAFKTRLWS